MRELNICFPTYPSALAAHLIAERGDEGGAKMTRSLPSYRNLEDIRREARELLHSLQRRDPSALRRRYSLDSESRSVHARLADAQYVVAREYGYSSWQKLKERLATNL